MATEGEVIFPQKTITPQFQRHRKVGQYLPIFLFLLIFLQFHHLCELMCESEHLLEQKKTNYLNFLCENGTMTSGGR